MTAPEAFAKPQPTLDDGAPSRHALLIAARVERAFDLEPGVGGGCADQLDHGKTIRERSAAPVLRNVAEETMLDLVPLRCAWRIVVDVDRKPGLVGELLQWDCHIAVRRARSIGGSGIVRLLRLRSATWSSPQREGRGAFGLK